MKSVSIFLALLLLAVSTAKSQTKILKPLEEGQIDTPEVPVQRTGSFFSAQIPLGNASPRLPLRTLRSLRFQFGLKYLHEVIRDGYSMGGALSFVNQTYAIDSEADGKNVMDTINYDTELFRNSGLQLDYLHRIRITGYEVSFAAYVEIGGHVSWFFNRRYIREESTNSGATRRMELRNLDKIESFQFGSTLTLGYNRLALVYMRRLTPYFKANAFSFLPRNQLGLQIGL